MADYHFCWRCQIEVPMLDDSEWDEMRPLLKRSIRMIQQYRERTGATLPDALSCNRDLPALVRYQEMTGFTETDVNAIWHHYRGLYGPECKHCGRLLRTPLAKLCAACGHLRESLAQSSS